MSYLWSSMRFDDCSFDVVGALFFRLSCLWCYVLTFHIIIIIVFIILFLAVRCLRSIRNLKIIWIYQNTFWDGWNSLKSPVEQRCLEWQWLKSVELRGPSLI